MTVNGLVDADDENDDYSTTDNTSSISDESSEFSEQKIAAFTKQKLSSHCTSFNEWPIDTGASSYITDDINLFSGLLKCIKPKTIQVGGGPLISKIHGTLKVVDED